MNIKDKFLLQNREIRFEVTNKCNARCIMCPREKMKREEGVLDMDLYKRVLDEAHKYGATVVLLENFGETFLDPFFFERAAYAKNLGMKVYTVTNGSLLDKEKADKAIEYLDKIRFSVYGTTKEVYEGIHIDLNFETVLNNIEYLVKEKKRRGNNTLQIAVYMVYLKKNRHQVEAFKKKWVDYVDEVAIWKPHNWGDGRNFRTAEHGVEKVTCGRPTKGPIQVQWDGLVVPCCFDYDSKIVLGDLNKISLYDVATGEQYNGLRKAHNESHFSAYPFCDSCDQLNKREDVLLFSTVKNCTVGAVNTTFDLL